MGEEAIRVKAVLHRSNPQIIRELRIPADTTFPELERILQTSLGWTEEEKGFRFEADGRSFPPGTTAGEALHPGDYVRYVSDRRYQWELHLEVVERMPAGKRNCAEVLRSRGSNPPQACMDLNSLNHVLDRWFNTGGGSYFWHSVQERRAADYVFRREQVNRRLRLLSEGSGTTASPLSEYLPEDLTLEGAPLHSCNGPLNTLSVNRLKDMAQRLGVTPVPAGKSALISEIRKIHMTEDGCRRIIFRLTEEEHRAFLDLLTAPGVYEEETWPRYRKLYDFGCLFVTSDESLVLAEEFVKKYIKLHGRKDFWAELSQYRCAAELIRLGCRLYGILSGEDRELLSLTWYPDRLETDELERLTSEFVRSYENEAYSMDASDGIVYFRGEVDASRVKQLWKQAKQYPAFVPDLEAAKRIAGDGLSFQPDQTEQLDRELRFAGYPEPRIAVIRKAIYRMLQMGKTCGEIYRYYFQTAGSYRRGRNHQTMIEEMLGRLREHVRLAEYHGHTPDEAAR